MMTFAPSQNSLIEETIQDTHYKFDTQECATMFKRFIDVYGKEFQPLLGDKQYIADPFWNRILLKKMKSKPSNHKRKMLQMVEEKRQS